MDKNIKAELEMNHSLIHNMHIKLSPAINQRTFYEENEKEMVKSNYIMKL
jgi:hypothetical protein